MIVIVDGVERPSCSSIGSDDRVRQLNVHRRNTIGSGGWF